MRVPTRLKHHSGINLAFCDHSCCRFDEQRLFVHLQRIVRLFDAWITEQLGYSSICLDMGNARYAFAVCTQGEEKTKEMDRQAQYWVREPFLVVQIDLCYSTKATKTYTYKACLLDNGTYNSSRPLSPLEKCLPNLPATLDT